VGAAARTAGRHVLQTFDELMRDEATSTAAVEDTLIERTSDGPLQRVASALARERFPVSASAVASETGLATREVGEVLRSSPAFVRVNQGWQLGRSGLRMR
jgi:hypothetical protein